MTEKCIESLTVELVILSGQPDQNIVVSTCIAIKYEGKMQYVFIRSSPV